jgi:serine/threonine-protein kinase Chk1
VVTLGVVTATTTNRRGGSLVFKIAIDEVNRKVLLDFRLSRGDGIEFKRLFALLAERIESMAL